LWRNTYSITRDKPWRAITKPTRYGTNEEKGFIVYILSIALETREDIESSTYSEVIFYPNSSNLLVEMQKLKWRACIKIKLGSYVSYLKVAMPWLLSGSTSARMTSPELKTQNGKHVHCS